MRKQIIFYETPIRPVVWLLKMTIPLEQNGDFIMCCDPSLDLNPLIPKKIDVPINQC
jgi:hypothetical protein